MTLLSIKKGESATIKKLKNPDKMKSRLMDMGLTPGTLTKVLFEAPSGDPRAFLVRGAVIALRKKDCGVIETEDVDDG